jgi:hypothetical protein
MVCVVALACLFSVTAFTQQCRQATFQGHVNGNEPFGQALGSGLEFSLWPMKENGGWTIQVTLHPYSADWAWVVNPPYHFENSQCMGNGYGETVRYQLEHPHQVWFPLDKADFDQIAKLAGEAIWPYTSKEPEKAAATFEEAKRKAPLGLLVVNARDYDKSGASDQQGGWTSRLL